MLTAGEIAAVEILNEATALKPIKLKSRPEGESLFGSPLQGHETMNSYAPAKRIHSFHPPQRTLMGPGPTEIHPRVLTTMSQPAIGYLDPVFVEMMEELKTLLRYVYQTKNALTFPISGPGSVGMEYCFVNLVAPGDKVVVCRNGVFGGRMIENVERCGGVPIVVEDAWGEPVDPQKLEDALKSNRDVRVVAFVHAETSTGCQSDAKIARRDRAPARCVRHRRRGHLARRDAGAGRRMGHRCDLLGEPEVPLVHAGTFAGFVLRARGRLRQSAQGQDQELVHGHESAARILGRHQPHLSSHRADQFTVRAARGAAADPRGRHRELLGAPPPPSSRAQGRASSRWASKFLVKEQHQLPQMNAVKCPDGRRRGRGAAHAAQRIRARDRRRPRTAGRARSGASA